MVFRKHNSTAGFSLIEVLVAITILGLVVVPIGSSLVLSFRLNARSEQMLQAQLAVSSAVETIMAEGLNTDSVTEFSTPAEYTSTDPDDYCNRFPDVFVKILDDDDAAYQISVASKEHDAVSVTTYVRLAPPASPDLEEGGGD